VVKRLAEGLNRMRKPLNGSRVLVLGFAYKRNTGDARESPGRTIVQLLRGTGAVVRVCDPHVGGLGTVGDALGEGVPVTLVPLNDAELDAADAVILVTDHEAFDLDRVASRASYVLDTRGRIAGPNVERL
jgi:UDP-N-acetyl-D-glucosamine dehydrogenase